MKSLEVEALEYVGINPDELVDLGDKRIKDAGHFIAGANSKWVQAEKIKAQIDLLTELLTEGVNILNVTLTLETFKEALKELEDENI
jgi:hypothetical protein